MTILKAGKFSPLDPAAAEPFYRQIYDRVRGAIAVGALKPGDRIPSARALTKELGPGTRHHRSRLFAAGGRGLHSGEGQAGTIVTPGLKPPAPMASPMPRGWMPASLRRAFARIRFCRSRWACRRWTCFRARSGRASAHGACVPCSRPTWCIPPSTGCRHCARRSPPISRSRAASTARPSQIFVTSGYRQTIELIGHALVEGRRPRLARRSRLSADARELLGHMGIATVPVPVDRDGMVVVRWHSGWRRGRARPWSRRRIKARYACRLTLPRRLALLDWATRNNAWIIEDDYDGEYRYVSRPLAGIEESGSGRARALCGHLQQGAVSRPPACLSRRARSAGRTRFEQISQVLAVRKPRTDAGDRHGLHLRRPLRPPYPADAQALCRKRAEQLAPASKACWASTCASIRSRAECT